MHFLGPGRHAAPLCRLPDAVRRLQHAVASIGAFGFGLMQVYFFLFVVVPMMRGQGEPAPQKPWEGAEGLEWEVPSPAPWHTFETPPKLDATATKRGRLIRTDRAGAPNAARPTCGWPTDPGLSVALVFAPGFCGQDLAARAQLSTAMPLTPSASLANRRMLGKLLVVVALMFGFGYALVPMYRAICDALGINVLSLSEQREPGQGAGARSKGQHAGRHHAHDHGRVRRQRARPLGLQARGALAAGAPGRDGHGDVRVPQRAEPHDGGAGHPQLCAAAGLAALQQARVLLLQRIHAGAGRVASSGRWSSSSTPSCRATSPPSRCPTPSSRWGQGAPAPPTRGCFGTAARPQRRRRAAGERGAERHLRQRARAGRRQTAACGGLVVLRRAPSADYERDVQRSTRCT
jgi:hypothetical protein